MSTNEETKKRLLEKHVAKAIEDLGHKRDIDLTPIIIHLEKSLENIENTLLDEPKCDINTAKLKRVIYFTEWKEEIQNILYNINKEQNSKMPKNIHILSIYLFPQLYDYAAKYEPTTDCHVSPVYDAIGKVLSNWSGHEYYGENK
jgi:hypothetical protein